jgi:Ca-activated chloride channel homolog
MTMPGPQPPEPQPPPRPSAPVIPPRAMAALRAQLPVAAAPLRVMRPRKVWRIVGLAVGTLVVAAAALVYPLVGKSLVAWRQAEWQESWALWGLVIVPALWWWCTLAQDARRPRIRVGTLSPLVRSPRGWRVRIRDLPGILRPVAVALMFVALARPVQVLSDVTGDEEGIDIVIVIDLSGSMQAVLDADPRQLPREFRPPPNQRLTRLDTAKVVVNDFIERRQTDRIGVVVFGKSPYVLSPPTLDYQLLSKLVTGLRLGVVDGSKTAIGDGLGTAVSRLRKSDALSKVIILLTDGDNNAGRMSPDFATDAAVQHGAKVYTVQIGDNSEVEVFRGLGRFGEPVYTKQRYPTNPELLRQIAERTGGKAFIATDAQGLRQSMHSILDSLEKTRFEASIAHYEDLFPYFLIPAVLLVGLEALLRALLLRRFP